jgi:hypothetical protein
MYPSSKPVFLSRLLTRYSLVVIYFQSSGQARVGAPSAACQGIKDDVDELRILQVHLIEILEESRRKGPPLYCHENDRVPYRARPRLRLPRGEDELRVRICLDDLFCEITRHNRENLATASISAPQSGFSYQPFVLFYICAVCCVALGSLEKSGSYIIVTRPLVKVGSGVWLSLPTLLDLHCLVEHPGVVIAVVQHPVHVVPFPRKPRFSLASPYPSHESTLREGRTYGL